MYYLLGQVGDVLLFNLDVPLEHAGDVGDDLLFNDHLMLGGGPYLQPTINDTP